MIRHNFETHVSAKEDFVLRLIQYRRDDNRVSPWMGDIMQSLPDKERCCRRTCNTKKEGERTAWDTASFQYYWTMRGGLHMTVSILPKQSIRVNHRKHRTE